MLSGAEILWFGWFGFNAGSALSAGTVRAYALVNTQLGACTAMLAWMGIEWWTPPQAIGRGHRRWCRRRAGGDHPHVGLRAAVGLAIIIGAAAGFLCYGAVHLKDIFHYDDSLDVVGVHMVGGAIGVVLTGVFASLAVNAAGAAGGWTQLGRQAVLAVVGIAFPFVMTWIILWVTDHTVGLRVSSEDEQTGLDLSEHAEVAYQIATAPELTRPARRPHPGA